MSNTVFHTNVVGFYYFNKTNASSPMDKPDLNDDGVLDELRIKCRNEMEALQAVQYIEVLLPLAIEGRTKAIQVLCNICYHVPSAREIVYKDGMADLVNSCMATFSDNEELMSLGCRLLFLATIGIDECDDRLRKCCFKLLSKGDEVKLFALRTLYNILKSVEDNDDIDRLLELASSCTNSDKVKGAAVNVLLKAKVDILGSKVTSSKLLDLVNGLFECQDKTVIQDHLPSYCQLVMNIVDFDDKKRHELRSKLCHNELLINHLKSSYPELVLACGDLIMSLVKHNVKRFIHAVGGYGKAAGYMYMRKIDTENVAASKADSDDLSSDEEYLEKHGLEDQSLSKDSSNDVEMTEEEKEREAERLLDLFDRLEKTGVVKVLRKDDSDANAN